MSSTIHFHRSDTYTGMSAAAADFIVQAIRDKPNLLLCPATGNSPKGAYATLVDELRNQQIAHTLRLVALDEWVGLPVDSPHSGAFQVRQQLIEPLGIHHYFLFDGNFTDEAAELQRAGHYLAVQGPIDLCILGIGTNGHLGFNEPGDYLHALPHRVRLTETSRGHQMVAGAARAPDYGITLGMKDILQAKKILLLVHGEHKRAAMTAFLRQEITPRLPASFLWLHPDVTCFCDAVAVP